MAPLRNPALFLTHLRVPFQLTLAPIFLWGASLSGGHWDGGTTAAFIALHLFLYPAATAFNSAYDKDEGPVSGLQRPPQVPPGLLGFALVLGGLGAGVAALTGWRFLVVYGLIALWTVAYSHPATRWKASPWKSAAAIGLGQGAIGFAAGWIAAAPLDFGDPALLAGAAGAALTALGLYPATQVFQVDEDRARGDRTLAVALGPARALRFGALCLLGAGAVTAWLVAQLYGPSDAFLIALGYVGLIAAMERLARTGSSDPSLYARAMRITRWGTAGFLLFLALQAIGSG
ncbi:MAG TPA: UbiA family prenyltransferase [Allosphingosinicella sp.]|jgi:1,4-dihydroxy-2-naphthoate octaprenyltransferase|nr:UbiA family prenyltransferase [Allosphingosinicella sp.]